MIKGLISVVVSASAGGPSAVGSPGGGLSQIPEVVGNCHQPAVPPSL